MKQLVIAYPKGLPGLLKLSEEQFAVEVRFLAAAKLFELGKLSSGKAAEMAGIGRVGVSPQAWCVWLPRYQSGRRAD